MSKKGRVRYCDIIEIWERYLVLTAGIRAATDPLKRWRAAFSRQRYTCKCCLHKHLDLRNVLQESSRPMIVMNTSVPTQYSHRLNDLQAEVDLDMPLAQGSEPSVYETPAPLEVEPCPVCWPANFLSLMVRCRDVPSAVFDSIPYPECGVH